MSIARRQLSPTPSRPSVVTCSGVVCLQLEIYAFQGLPELSVHLPSVPGLYWITGKHEVQSHLGANGVGKTSLLNALTWACTGSTGEGVSGPKIVNYSMASKARVESHFSDERWIVRTQNPNSLTLNGKVHDPKDFHKAFGCSWEVWSQTVHHAQGERLFLDLSPGERAQVLSDLLNLSLWENLAEDARKLAKQVDGDARQLEGTVLSLQREETVRQTGIANLEQQIVSRDRKREEEQARREEVAERLRDRIKVLEQECETQKDVEKTLDLRVRRQEARVTFLQAEMDKLVALTAELRQSRDRAVESHAAPAEALRQKVQEASVQCESAMREGTRLKSDLRLFNEVGPTCSKCLQSVPLSHRSDRIHEMEKLISAAEDKHTDAIVIERRFKEQLRELQERQSNTLQALSVQIQSILDSESAKRIEFRNTSKVLSTLREQINSAFQAQVRMKAEIDQLRAQELQLAPQEEEQADDSLELLLQDAQAQLAAAQKALQVQTQVLTQTVEQRDAFTFWGKHYFLLRLRLMDQALAELSMLSSPYLEQLGLEGWSFEFSTQQATQSGSVQQKLEIEIRRPGENDTTPLAGCSGGERTRLRLAAQMALAAATVEAQQFGFEVWDEPSAYLSGSGLQDLLEVLSQRARQERKAIFLVDHTVPDYAFDGILTLVKRTDGVTAQWTR